MAAHEARLEQAMRAFQQQAAKAAELKDKIGELRGQGSSADGSVTVTVAPSGAVLGLQLTPAAMRRSHTQLQQDILGAIRQATQQAAAALQETVQPLLGDRAKQFRDAFEAHVPQVGPAEPSTGTPPPNSPIPVRTSRNRTPSGEVEDDDFGGPILR
ncbi:MAG TPA: YbaB/EbfC family nucleoid-associated protein [Amycolatopsis sp.]|uniref:YbaB/EbfC family nucleoid-associated protein n=1 Tax=Amycolatopsis sp. TaxID=37632 RepID=UPI002B49A8BE|nr:YbaB/EbfC family nucleoid-associated protein [Amycolatopsis sp.]HKS48152.1 YbaB/EbfC family nucleoid-associated protein [Amycolatopsis sp.]